MATLMRFLILSGGNKVYLYSRILAIYVDSEMYVEIGVGTFLPSPTPAAPKLLPTPTPQPWSEEDRIVALTKIVLKLMKQNSC
jgi:hypothetical protein